MRAGKGAIRNAVAIHVEIAAEIASGVQLLRRHHLAAIHPPCVVPGEWRAEPLVHADIEIEQHENRRLQALREIERGDRHLEALVRVLGKQQHVLGVAVRGIGAGEHVGLLRARRHAGGRAAALHVEDHRRDLGEIAEADEFLHQRDAGPRGRGEGARAVPAGADHHADRGELVLRLDDCVAMLAGRRIDAVSARSSARTPPPSRRTA